MHRHDRVAEPGAHRRPLRGRPRHDGRVPTGGYLVTSGTTNLADPGHVSTVDQVIPYPGFVKITESNRGVEADGDAALLQLTEPVSAHDADRV